MARASHLSEIKSECPCVGDATSVGTGISGSGAVGAVRVGEMVALLAIYRHSRPPPAAPTGSWTWACPWALGRLPWASPAPKSARRQASGPGLLAKLRPRSRAGSVAWPRATSSATGTDSCGRRLATEDWLSPPRRQLRTCGRDR